MKAGNDPLALPSLTSGPLARYNPDGAQRLLSTFAPRAPSAVRAISGYPGVEPEGEAVSCVPSPRGPQPPRVRMNTLTEQLEIPSPLRKVQLPQSPGEEGAGVLLATSHLRSCPENPALSPRLAGGASSLPAQCSQWLWPFSLSWEQSCCRATCVLMREPGQKA